MVLRKCMFVVDVEFDFVIIYGGVLVVARKTGRKGSRCLGV